MRVHPTILASRGAKWQFPAAIGLLLFLLVLNLMRGPREEVVAVQPQEPVEKRLEVVVARESIQPGQALDKANVALEQRPVSTVPTDVITSFEALKNKVAAGPIPAGYPLATALLADPIAVIPVAESAQSDTPEDPLETLLKEIEQDTVAIPVSFVANAPPRGTRVAITLSNTKGESVVISEDCWIFQATGREAKVRVDPSQALLLQAAKAYGNFNFIEIPNEGQSPYAGKGVTTREQLAELIEGQGAKAKQVAADAAKKKMLGYAWVSGEGVRYGLDESGQIKIMSPNPEQ